ncbi:MAG: HAMP domain-containing protein [Polyangiaceae bacterium]|nr:HAMP domain-containing protein [Polyangiaceae bacterium]NUQ76174.1 HAMP domain-containing protein [Polyangiaceae bacterium]
MSEQHGAPSTRSGSSPRGRDQRSAKNYLIDRRFQLKYTGLLVGIALVLSAALGLILWSTSSQVIEQSRKAVKQGQVTVQKGQETVKRGQQVLEISRNLTTAVRMDVERQGNPDLIKAFEEDTVDDERKRKEEQDRLVSDAASLKEWAAQLEQQANEVERQQRDIGLGLLVVLSLLVVCVGLAGIVFTHKVAGPIYKMKRLLPQVGEGKLIVRERLRRGDELHDFFAAFEKMVDDLRHRKETEIATIDKALAKLEASEGDAHREGVAMLKSLRSEMREHVEG